MDVKQPTDQTDQTQPPQADQITTPPAAPVASVVLLSVPGGIPDVDADLKATISLANGSAVRVRVPLSLFAEGASENYEPWRKVAWIAEFRKPELAKDFREGLDAFIRCWVEATARGLAVSVAVEEK